MSDDSSTGLEGGDFVYLSLEFHGTTPTLDAQRELASDTSAEISYGHPFRDTFAILLGRGASPELEEELYGASVGDTGLVEITWTEDIDAAGTAGDPPHIRAPARSVDDMLPEWLATISRQEGAVTPHEFVDLSISDIADEYMLDPERLEDFQSQLADSIDGWLLAKYEVADGYRWADTEPAVTGGTANQSPTSTGIQSDDQDRMVDSPTTASDWWPMSDGTRLLTGATEAEIPTQLPRTVWQVQVPGSVETAPIITERLVIIGNNDGSISVFNQKGEKIWSHELSGSISCPPIYTDGTVFLGEESGVLTAIDIQTIDSLNKGDVNPSKKWKQNLADSIHHVNIGDDSVLVRTEGGELHALSPENGEKEWKIEKLLGSNKILVWKNIAITRSAEWLLLIDTDTGAISEKVEVGDRNGPTGAISRGRIITGDQDGIVCLSIEDNRSGTSQGLDPMWRTAVGGQVRTTPTIFDSLITVTTNRRRVYGFDWTDGEKLWSKKFRHDLTSPPVTDGNTILVSSTGNTLFALDATDGTVQWNVPAGGAVWAPPAVTDGTVYVADNEGFVSALR